MGADGQSVDGCIRHALVPCFPCLAAIGAPVNPTLRPGVDDLVVAWHDGQHVGWLRESILSHGDQFPRGSAVR